MVFRRFRVLDRWLGDLWSDGRGWTLVAISSGWFLGVGARTIYPVMLPHLREAFGFGYTTAGLLLTAVFVSYASGQPPGGVLADRIGEGTVMVLSTFVAAGTIVVIALANSTAVLFLATVLFGFGTGLFGVARFTAVANIYPDAVGTANGVINAVMDAGQSIMPAIAGVLAVAFAWQYGFGFAVPLFVLSGVGIWVAVPSRTSGATSAVDTVSLRTGRYVLGVLRRPRIVYATLVTVMSFSVWMTFTGFYPSYLVEVKGFSEATASTVYGVFFALGVVVKPVVGGAYDRVGPRRAFLTVVSVFGLALLVLPFVEGIPLLLAVTVPLSTVLGWNTLMETYLSVTMPDDVQNTGFGILRAVYFGVAGLAPTLFGAVADRGLFAEAFLGLAAVVAVVFLLVARLPADRGRERGASGGR